MRRELKYIELKTGYSGNGPAWIGWAAFSKSGRSVYFAGKSFKRSAQAISGNHLDLHSRITGPDEYWISSPKKNCQDRRGGSQSPVYLQSSALNAYLKLIGQSKLPVHIRVIDIPDALNLERLHQLENQSLAGFP